MSVTQFTNVTMYKRSPFLGNFDRIDARAVTVTYPVRWAQYEGAAKVVFSVPRGKKERYFFIPPHEAFFIVPREEAVKAPGIYENGVSKFRSFSAEWTSEVRDLLQTATILFEMVTA